LQLWHRECSFKKLIAVKVTVSTMNELEITKAAREQEKEIVNILIGSSLYLDMSQANREKLLNYLVASYFDPLPGENSRALPKANQIVPATSIETH
jgi:hypothetical protein